MWLVVDFYFVEVFFSKKIIYINLVNCFNIKLLVRSYVCVNVDVVCMGKENIIIFRYL